MVAVLFVHVMFVVLGDTGYEMPGVVWLIPPFLFLGGLTTAGYLHKDGE